MVKTSIMEAVEIDPFCTGVLDFQRQFGDLICHVLLFLAQKVFNSSRRAKFKNFDKEFIDLSTEDAMKDPSVYDPYRLLDSIVRSAEYYAEYLGIEKDRFQHICEDLLEVRNMLAHTRYLADDSTKKSTPQRTTLFTSTYMDRGMELVSMISEDDKKVFYYHTVYIPY